MNVFGYIVLFAAYFIVSALIVQHLPAWATCVIYAFLSLIATELAYHNAKKRNSKN